MPLLPASDSLLSLRPYGPADRPDVRRLHDLAFRTLAAAQHSQAQINAHAALIAAPEYEADLDRSNLLLGWHAEAGLIATAGWLPVADRPLTARIRKVFVHPDRARRGLASRLVREVEERATAEGFPQFFVRANINAVPLYLSLGYREEGAGSCPPQARNCRLSIW